MNTRQDIPDIPAIHFNQASNWEASRISSAERSERRAWMVAGCFGIGFLLAIVAIVIMMPLKTVDAQFYRIDNSTGAVETFSVLDDVVATNDEVMNAHWLSRFVIHYETYNWHTLQTDYDTIGLLSSADVGAQYQNKFDGEGALNKLYAHKIKQDIKVINVVPTGDYTAAVRFIRTTTETRTGNVKDTERFLATIAFDYEGEQRTDSNTRLINPLGFKVTSYRVDAELAGVD